MEFQGKVVVVTGAAQGIGKEIARQFALKKARVVLVDLNEKALKETEAELSSHGEVMSSCTDVTNLKEIEGFINKIIDKYTKIDILINNAGITKDNLLLRLSENDWDKVLAVNLKGAFNCTKAAAKHMLKARSGKIVNISSVIGIMGNPGQVNYAASKAALIGMTKTLSKELGSRNITVNAVAPGYIRTAMTDALPDKVTEAMRARIPLARLGEPLDVAKAVLFLASPSADYITGHVLVVDGGLI